MKKYRYDKNKVIENFTKLIIKVCKTKPDAKNICDKLNSGTGFQGNTPFFFVYKKQQTQ